MRAVDQDPLSPPGASMLFYRAALPLSRKTLTFVSGIIRRHRISIGSPWRKLNAGQQGLLVLVYLRKGGDVRPGRGGVRGRRGHRLEIRERDRRPAGCPRAEAPQ